jgi:hypothetical protein
VQTNGGFFMAGSKVAEFGVSPVSSWLASLEKIGIWRYPKLSWVHQGIYPPKNSDPIKNRPKAVVSAVLFF